MQGILRRKRPVELIGIGATAAANILQEFVVRKLTPNLPKRALAKP